MAIPFAPAIIGAIANLLSSSVARFAALKVLLLSMFTIVLPYVLHKVIFFYMERGLSLVNSETTSLTATTVELTNMAAWLGNLLKLPLCLSIILAAVSIRLSLKLLRVV